MRLIVILLITLSSTLQATPLKIGYININHLVSSSPQFIQANQLVVKELRPQKNKLLILGKQAQLLVNSFNKNNKDLTQNERKSEIKKIASLESELKRQTIALKKQLKLRDKQELNKIQDLINQIIKKVAKEQKFDLILYQKVAYASKKINITPMISQKLRLLFE
jgi:outer membrane protein